MKNKFNKFAIIALFSVFGAALTASAVGLNGGFENGSTPGTFITVAAGDSATINNWTVNTGSVDYIGTYWPASEGSRSIDMSGNSAGSISQSFPTTIGSTYNVSFSMSGNPECTPGLRSMDVVATGGSPANYTYDTNAEGNTLANMKWKSKTYSFVATSVNTTLTFTSLTTSACGPALDNVVISSPVTTSTVIVTGNTAAGENQPGWLFNRDPGNVTPYTFNTNASSIGMGSLYVLPIGSTPSDKMVAENFIATPIANVNSISYDFRIGATGNPSQAGQFYMNVYANFGVSSPTKYYDCRYNVVPVIGSTGGFTTVTFDPTQAYLVAQKGSSPFTCPAVPADMNLLSPGSNIRAFSLNVGDGSVSDLGVSGYLDKVVVSTVSNITTYDFEPTKENCKKDGWKTFTNPKFKNQGQCVSSFEGNEDGKKDDSRD